MDLPCHARLKCRSALASTECQPAAEGAYRTCACDGKQKAVITAGRGVTTSEAPAIHPTEASGERSAAARFFGQHLVVGASHGVNEARLRIIIPVGAILEWQDHFGQALELFPQLVADSMPMDLAKGALGPKSSRSTTSERSPIHP